MYIENTLSYCDNGGEQRARRARFLILMQPPSEWIDGKYHSGADKPIKAIVRKVALRQFGHFMMGVARAFGQSITISGAYGSDGLPCNVPEAIYERGLELPSALVELWNNGGGWNSCGSEATAMRKWALENIAMLT